MCASRANGGFGGPQLSAPQAGLMAALAQGIVGGEMAWPLVIVGIAFYMLHNSLQTEATEIAPSARGSAVALFACGFFAGQAIGPLLFGALAHAAGFSVALLACSLGLLALGPLVARKVIARA